MRQKLYLEFFRLAVLVAIIISVAEGRDAPPYFDSFKTEGRSFTNSGFSIFLPLGFEGGGIEYGDVQNHVSFGISSEIMVKGFLIGVGLSGLTVKTKSVILVQSDSIPLHSEFGLLYFPLYTGYRWELSDRNSLTPYAGLDINTAYLSENDKKRLNIDPNIPDHHSLRLGLAWHFHIRKWFRQYGFLNGTSIGIRVDLGYSHAPESINRYPNRGRFGFFKLSIPLFSTHAIIQDNESTSRRRDTE